MSELQVKSFKALSVVLILVTCFGIALRFQNISSNHFMYYDEGLYLSMNRTFVEMIEVARPNLNFATAKKILNVSLLKALATGKPLWFFLSDLRGFFVSAHAWYVPRLLSALFASLAIVVAYLMGKHLFASRRVGLLSMALLATLPSHVYYSRLAMQESLSALCFLLALYLYILKDRFTWRVIVSAFVLVCVYLTNYRMIIAPALFLVVEALVVASNNWKHDYRKYLYHTIIYVGSIIVIGGLADGRHASITFAWMFHQADLAKDTFHWLNTLSYPYYILKLESVVFAGLFFSSVVLLFKKRFKQAIPFCLVMIQMAIFTMAQEKGVRYLCVMLPLMAIAAASILNMILEKQDKKVFLCAGLLLVTVLSWHSVKSYQLARAENSYQESINNILSTENDAKILSTQFHVQGLYHPNAQFVKEAPHTYQQLFNRYKQGFKYLVIDPQAYISYTQSNKRFQPPLEGMYQFIVEHIRPVAQYDHFDSILLERFVLEHNENLNNSLTFLSESKDKKYGQLRVYQLSTCISRIQKFLQLTQQKS